MFAYVIKSEVSNGPVIGAELEFTCDAPAVQHAGIIS